MVALIVVLGLLAEAALVLAFWDSTNYLVQIVVGFLAGVLLVEVIGPGRGRGRVLPLMVGVILYVRLRACSVRERVEFFLYVSVHQRTHATSLSDDSPVAQTAAEGNDLRNALAESQALVNIDLQSLRELVVDLGDATSPIRLVALG